VLIVSFSDNPKSGGSFLKPLTTSEFFNPWL
jgi:hypothetical protein